MKGTNITFAGERLFATGSHKLRVFAWERQQSERSFGGLSGTFSLDLGRRTRRIRQSGTLSAPGLVALLRMAEAIDRRADGQAHALMDDEGRWYYNVRMDQFSMQEPRRSGGAVSCTYEITYTQAGQ
jgi:hypothetical protein